MSIKPALFIALALVLAVPCVFFCYYTVRLLFLNLTSSEVRSHWSGGMLIGAVAFPLATLIFGALSLLSIKLFLRGISEK